jgi:shikimate kinase
MRIYIIGFMGSGKTHLGKLWAATYDMPFYDLDEMIEYAEQCSIEQLFEIKGEAYFRIKESEILKTTLQYEHAIIACGGGTACYFDNIQWMNTHGKTVFLNQTEENIYFNICKDTHQRPLLTNKNETEVKAFIQMKYAERMPFYTQCQIVLLPNQMDVTGFLLLKNNDLKST